MKNSTKKSSNQIQKIPISFDYDTVLAFVEFSYSNAAKLKLKNLVNIISLSVCYGCKELMELCKSYCRYKTQKVIENSMHDNETSLSSYKPKPNPLVIIDCAVATYDENFLKEILSELLVRIRRFHLTENSLVQISFPAMKLILSSDQILVDEIDLIEFYMKWAFLHEEYRPIGDDFNCESSVDPLLNSLPASEKSVSFCSELNQVEDISGLLRFYLLDDAELDILKATNAISEKTLKMTRYVKNHFEYFQDLGLKRRQGTKIRPHFSDLGII